MARKPLNGKYPNIANNAAVDKPFTHQKLAAFGLK